MSNALSIPEPARAISASLLAVLAVAGAVESARAITTELILDSTGDPNAWLGSSVAPAGDVNGDGYLDMIVGATHETAGTVGHAYVFFGGEVWDDVADWVLDGVQVDDRFGRSVAAAGDVNGDGYGDVVVGAFVDDTGASNAGRAYVYLGGPAPDTVPDVVLTGTQMNEFLGSSVSGAGDVNGDGFADVIVGSPGFNGNAGRVTLLYGGNPMDAVPDRLIGGAAGDALGASVSDAGDVNADGFDDFVVGQPGNESAGTAAGLATLHLGAPDVGAMTFVGIFGDADDQLGRSVAGVGDINGDGFDDLAIGAPGRSTLVSNAGSVRLYFGGPPVDGEADATIDGETISGALGTSVAGAGDVNGDGFGDIVAGAPNEASNAGMAYVYLGGTSPSSADAIPLIPGTGAGFFGQSVASVGDTDGDGRSDVVVGAPRENDMDGRVRVFAIYPYRLLSPIGGEQWVVGEPAAVSWRGRDIADVHVSVDGGLTWSRVRKEVGGDLVNEVEIPAPRATDEALVAVSYQGGDLRASRSDRSDSVFRIVAPHEPPALAKRRAFALAGSAPGVYFGSSVDGAGDIDGDGYEDIIVSAPLNAQGGPASGSVYIFFQGPSADDQADIVFDGPMPSALLGISVTGAGDLNGDGFDDVAIGSALGDGGEVHVHFGGPGVDTVPDVVMVADGAVGVSVDNAGDVNGDGYTDLIVGASFSGANDEGEAYIYFGGPGVDEIADVELIGEGVDDRFGFSVAGAGDVDGDGFDDVIVGALRNDAGGSDAGRAYLYLGGHAPDALADVVFTGSGADSKLGTSVAGAGDVNGDGFDDVLVGADEDGVLPGRAYLFLGGPGLDGTPDLELTAGTTGDLFGSHVAGVGDLNDDGYDDVAVGAWLDGSSAPGAGRAYVFFGSPAPDAVPDLVFDGEAPGDHLGLSLARAGDTTGDGVDDLLIGIRDHDGSTGLAHLYDMARYHVLSPSAGDIWAVGASRSLSWSGAEPADVWLSVDGGDQYSLLRSGVGGAATNTIALTVPHRPTRFAKVRVTPHDTAISGAGEVDSLFTIEASIELLAFRALPGDGGGVLLRWETDPGPDDIAGYILDRAPVGSDEWHRVATMVRETSHHDPSGAPVFRYRLTGVNGLGEELRLGETSPPPVSALSASPLPYRAGALIIRFATYGGLGGSGSSRARVELFDVRGRRVRSIVDAAYPAGMHAATWDGLDGRGHRVPAGVYFLQATNAASRTTLRLVVAR